MRKLHRSLAKSYKSLHNFPWAKEVLIALLNVQWRPKRSEMMICLAEAVGKQRKRVSVACVFLPSLGVRV